jgi:hypothetical protein
MTNLGHVYVLKSKYRDELNNLEKERKMNSTLLGQYFPVYFIIGRTDCYFNNNEFSGIYNAASLSAVYYFISRKWK